MILEAMYASAVRETRARARQRVLERTFREWRKVSFGDGVFGPLVLSLCHASVLKKRRRCARERVLEPRTFREWRKVRKWRVLAARIASQVPYLRQLEKILVRD
jgi:hypothetical protein